MQLHTKIREEYAKLHQENNQLKIEMQKYRHYIERSSQTTYRPNYQKPIRKRKYYYINKVMVKVHKVILILQKSEGDLKKQKRKRIIMKTK